MSNSLLSSAVIAVIVVVVSGYVISSSVDIDTVADVVFTAMLNVAYATHGVLSLNATDSIDHLDGTDLELTGAWDITTFKSDVKTYAIVAAFDDDGIQILNITDPSNITTAGKITGDGTNTDDLELNGARAITTFKSGGHTYAAVAANADDGVQILNITDPSNITAAGKITGDGTNTDDLELNGAYDIATFKSGTGTYAAVAANVDDGVQILNITDPSNITAAGKITGDGTNTDDLELNGARGITTFKSGTGTYAAVVANVDDGVQILNITDPSNITAAGSATHGGMFDMDNPSDVAIFNSTGGTYAAISAFRTIQILNITDPSTITAAGKITDSSNLDLHNSRGITTFKSGDHVYAAVAVNSDDGVQILDVTDPSNITAAGSIDDTGDTNLELDGAIGITIFNSNGNTYAAVAAYTDSGVQIIRIDVEERDVTPPVISVTGPLSVTIVVGDTYDDKDVTCTDETDPSPTLTPSIVVDTSQAGEYIVTYSCIDAATNSAEQVTRTVIVLNSLSLTPTSNIGDDTNLQLLNGRGITTFNSSGHTYAAVASNFDHGVQILNITDPLNITAAGSIKDNNSLLLEEANGITTFESDGHIYAAVTAKTGNGVQILNITNPSIITAAGSIIDSTSLILNSANDITTFISGPHTYVAVTAKGNTDNGVQILNVTNPSNITPAGNMNNTANLKLQGAQGITTFTSGSHTYAAVAAINDDGVQILNITNPSTITAAGQITDTTDLLLNGANGIATFASGPHTYAAVTAASEDGVQILNITNPSIITAAGNIANSDSLTLKEPAGITTFKLGPHTYAAVASYGEYGIQILNVTNPSNITPAGSIDDDSGGNLELDGASGITTFKSGAHTYLAVTGYEDSGVQIIRIGTGESDTTPPELTLRGNASVTLEVGDPYSDDGAECTDTVDGTITPTKTFDDVDTSQVGSYTVTYSCADAATNTVTVSRTVIVEDTTPPVITLTGNSSVTIEVGDPYSDDGAECTDTADGTITPTKTFDDVDTSQVGSYTVTYSCADAATNTVTVSRTVIVEDTTPPELTLTGNSSVTIEGGDPYSDDGAECTDTV